MDPIGIIEENYFSLTHPRCCDSTAPNMPAALREAGEWLAAGATKITLCTTRWDPVQEVMICLLYTSPSPRDAHESRMPSSA